MTCFTVKSEFGIACVTDTTKTHSRFKANLTQESSNVRPRQHNRDCISRVHKSRMVSSGKIKKWRELWKSVEARCGLCRLLKLFQSLKNNMDISSKLQLIFRKKLDVVHITPEYDEMLRQTRIIKEWKPQSDVWPLRMGRTILISVATASAMYINHRFRARMKLRSHGTFITMFGIMMGSSSATALSHSEFVLKKIILLDMYCPLCMESKAALIQTFSGLLFPMILTPLANFSISAGSGVYNVPHITEGRKIFGTIWSIYKPLLPKIAMIFTLQAVLAGYLTYLEIRSYLHILDLQYLMKESENYKNIM